MRRRVSISSSSASRVLRSETPPTVSTAAVVITAAVALLHSYRPSNDEDRVADALAAVGIKHMSLSGDVAPFMRIVPRAETAVVNAYLSPIIDSYLERIEQSCSKGSRLFMGTGLDLASFAKAKLNLGPEEIDLSSLPSDWFGGDRLEAGVVVDGFVELTD